MLMLSSLDSILSQSVTLRLAQHHLPLLLPLLPLLLLNANRKLTDSAGRFLSSLPAPLLFPSVSMFPNVWLFQGPNAGPPPGRSPTPCATPSQSQSVPPSPGLCQRPPVWTSPSLTAGPSPSVCPCPPRWRSAPPWQGRCASQSIRRLPARTALCTGLWLSTLTPMVTLPRLSAL